MDNVRGQTGSVFHKEQMLLENMRYLGDKQTIDVKLKKLVNNALQGRQRKPFVAVAAPY